MVIEMYSNKIDLKKKKKKKKKGRKKCYLFTLISKVFNRWEHTVYICIIFSPSIDTLELNFFYLMACTVYLKETRSICELIFRLWYSSHKSFLINTLWTKDICVFKSIDL